MIRFVTCCSLLLVLLSGQWVYGQRGNRMVAVREHCAECQKAKAQNVPEIPYEVVPNWLKWPADIHTGESAGASVNSKGHIFVFTRGVESRLFEFDQKGTLVREIGQGLFAGRAHQVRIDAQDNIWAVNDVGNTIVKFNPQGRVEMVLGKRPDPFVKAPETVPPAEPYNLNRPTDIAFDPAGNIYISDGYGNSRVVKYDKNGRFVKDVGVKGTAPGQFDQPHAIAADAKGNIYVADRNNGRIQIFDSDFNLKKIIDNVGYPWTLCVSLGPHQYLYSSNSNNNNVTPAEMAVTGEIYKMELDGTIVGKFAHAGKGPDETNGVNGMDCRNENEITIGNVASWRVQKFVLRPQAAAPAKVGQK
jgi:DNA-binding beta-propeller fold protein YncE